MSTIGILNGTSLIVTVESTVVAHATEHSISMTMATRDATTKSSAGWTTRLSGLRDWSISGSGLVAFDAAYGVDDLFALFNGRTVATVRFTTSETGDKYYEGEAYLTSLEQDSPLEDNVTYSFTFEAAGILTEGTET